MPRYRHLTDAALTHGFDTAFSRADAATADLLEYIADFSERKLYLPAGYPSLLDYCIEKLHRTRDSARRRIHAAHTAQQFPVVFERVAKGRLHLTAVILLAPYLTPDNADELFAAAEYRSKDEIRQLIQRRFLQPDTPKLIEVVGTASGCADAGDLEPEAPPAPGRVVSCAPERTEPCAPERTEAAKMARTPVHLDDEMVGLVNRAQALLGYELRSDDPKEVIRRSLRLLVGSLEKRKRRKPSPSRSCTTSDPRRIASEVMSAVWERDRGCCTFAGDNGHRCESKEHVEFDHIVPVARGGESTVENLRLRCRSHNQFEAERTFGHDFMKHKRDEARSAAAERQSRRMAKAHAATAQTEAATDSIPSAT